MEELDKIDWKNTALIVVDVQNDFCPGGTLAVPNGHEVIPHANRLINLAVAHGCPVLFSRDLHPEDTPHFNKWPRHCIQDTFGSLLHRDLAIPTEAVIHYIDKGMGDEDAYSAFEGYIRHDFSVDSVPDVYLQGQGIQHLVVCGLATDYCVKETVLDGLVHGYYVTLVRDACRGVTPETTQVALIEMEKYGAKIL